MTIRYFCDRCKKQVHKFNTIKFGYGLAINNNCILCSDCENEWLKQIGFTKQGDHITKMITIDDIGVTNDTNKKN